MVTRGFWNASQETLYCLTAEQPLQAGCGAYVGATGNIGDQFRGVAGQQQRLGVVHMEEWVSEFEPGVA